MTANKCFRFLSLLLFLVLSHVMQAGNIKVKSFKQLQPDVDMDNVYYPVKDSQGDRCALIKVFNADNSYSFSNVKKVVPHGREIWVYVTIGTTFINIEHQGDILTYSFKSAEDGVYILALYSQSDYNKAGAIATSCFVPGVGQMAFKNDYLKGSLILVTELGSIAALVACDVQQRSFKTQANMATTADEKISLMKTSDNYGTARNIMIGVAAGIYLYNVLDVILAKPRPSRNAIAVNPYIENINSVNYYGVNVAVKF